jgi:hypothetical protein
MSFDKRRGNARISPSGAMTSTQVSEQRFSLTSARLVGSSSNSTGALALEDAIDVAGRTPIGIDRIDPVN